MISLKNIAFVYPKSTSPAVDGISAELSDGIYLLVGENGAGKTTLLHILAGLLTPQHGETLIYGNPADSNLPSNRRRVFMLEDRMDIPTTTIRKFADVHSCFYPNFSEEMFNHNLQMFGLTGDEKMRTLSLGNRKKSFLAYVLALQVPVLLLDEPTNGLDIQSKDILRSMISSETDPDQTIIISTHNVEEFHHIYDGCIALRHGKTLLVATSNQISSLLEFRMTSTVHPDALYSELRFGRYSSIFEADSESDTDIDWRLLYKALMSPAKDKITTLFNK